jgi:5-methylthioadenosine/S-adenosylhomocysteine deaminase
MARIGLGLLLVEDGVVIPVDGTRRILPHTSIAIEENRIVGVGERSTLVRTFGSPESTIDAGGKFVLPGLVNTHTHLFQTFSRGLGMDMDLDDWWRTAIGRIAPRLSTKDVHDAALVGCIEAIRSGTTTVNDFMYLASKKGMSDQVIKAFDEIGVRGVLSRGIMDAVSDIAPAMMQDLDEALSDFRRLHRTFHAPKGRIKVWIAPSAFWSTTLKAFEESFAAARETGTRITFHCSETKHVVDYCKKTYGARDIVVLARKRLLGPDVLAVHCVWLERSDISVLRSHGVSVSHCPLANMILADGVAPIRDILKAGVTCSLATDGSASNNNQDMVGVMKATALLQKIHYLDPLAIRAWEVLEMATNGGARALGMEREIGSIRVGRKADLIIVDLKKPNTSPTYDPVANLVYSATPENITTVIIDGRAVMEDGEIALVDERSALRRLEEDSEKFRTEVTPVSAKGRGTSKKGAEQRRD